MRWDVADGTADENVYDQRHQQPSQEHEAAYIAAVRYKLYSSQPIDVRLLEAGAAHTAITDAPT
jgi:hypothetical protein